MAVETPKAKAEVKKPTANSKINKDGIEKGKVLTDNEYWALINKSKAKK